jgi:Fe-S cluster assembly ATPase SufC
MSELIVKNLQVSVETESGSKEILRGVDLTVKSGETHAIMGPNGSGKSTIVRLLYYASTMCLCSVVQCDGGSQIE